MWVFYFFAAIIIWLGLLSLRGGFRFAAYVKTELAGPLANYTPFATVIVPCRGVEDGLAANLSSLFRQSYPAYEIIFVTDNEKDPSLQVIQDIIQEQTDGVSRSVLIAGAATDSGQKVHNLRAAVAQIDQRSEVLVFVDSDARPHENWLRALVAPLADDQIGAASGYRWFVPVNGGFASRLRSVWNGSIASALGRKS